MSGFEIAGVVLAAFPLLISALEHYRAVSRKRDIFINRGLHVGRLINALTEQKVLIESDLELILRAAGFDDTDVGQLVAGQCLSLLSSGVFMQELEALLGDRSQQYVTTLGHCESNLFEIAKSLSNFKQGPWIHSGKLVDMLAINEGNSRTSSTSTEREVFRRLKFSLRKEDLDRKIVDLDKCTRMLRRIGEIGIAIHTQIGITASRKSAKLVRIFSKIRSQALLVYHALSLKWEISCHDNHWTELILEDRLETVRNQAPKPKPIKAAEFRLLLRAGSPKLNRKILWHDADINVFDSEALDTSSTSSISGVRFDLPDLSHSTQPPGQEVDDLCTCLEGAENQQKSLKLIVASQAKLYSVHLPLADRARQSWPSNVKLINLEGVLSSRGTSSMPRLKLMSRVKLAFLLASSLLQLHSTPWVGKHLTKNSVFFFLSTSSAPTIDTDHPALSCAFPSVAVNKSNRLPSAESSLLELGILIMELWHNQALENYFVNSNCVIDESYYNRLPLAKRWLDETEDEFVPSVLEAASRCIHCRFAYKSATATWDDEDFRRSVFDGVVKPLWESCSSQSRT